MREMRIVQREELIQIVKQIAEKEKREWLTSKEFTEKTGISMKKVLKYFEGWNDLVSSAGLQPLTKKGRPDVQKGYSENDLLSKIESVARKLGKKTLSTEEFYTATGISQKPIYRVFGTWEKALEKAGLEKCDRYLTKISDEELFEEYLYLYNQLGRFPLYRELDKLKYSRGTYESRFGNYTEFKKRAAIYGISKGILDAEIEKEIDLELNLKTENKSITYEKLDDRPIFGKKIDFKGLRHAPVNELGVVFLFGILAYELGFEVESVQSGFPDCLAKRKIKNDNWQNVRIEFEFTASNFLLHKHNQNECDLIVCWENDWKNCPLEVISLKEIVKKHNNKI